MLPDERGLRPETVAIAAGAPRRGPGDPLNVAVTLSSTYHAGGPVGYARDGNPTWTAFEETLGALEGGTALVFASGAGAISAVLEELPVGAVVVAPGDAYTGTRAYLADAAARGRLGVRLVDVADTEATLRACAGAALLWIESPTNPLLAVADIGALVTGVAGGAVQVVVDNTFATPLGQRPLDAGADIVVHSATKLIAGHSDVLLGAVVTRDQALAQRLHDRRTVLGAVAGPLETYLALRGLRSLALRLDRASANAEGLAHRLADHPAVSRVRYPGLESDPGHARAAAQLRGFGTIVSFEVRAGAAAAQRVCERVRLITHATSLGGIETTLERRCSHPGEDWTPAELIRVSVGCEHVEDLWADLAQALEGEDAPA